MNPWQFRCASRIHAPKGPTRRFHLRSEKMSETAIPVSGSVMPGESTDPSAIGGLWMGEVRSRSACAAIPKSKEHFISDRHDAVAAAIREGFQNGGDAHDKASGAPVLIRFSRVAFSSTVFWNRLMPGLKRHLEAVRTSARNLGSNFIENLNYEAEVPGILIQDYRTTGLLGIVDPIQNWEDFEFTNFGNFWWRQGGSSKDMNAGGRHGEGKNAVTGLSTLRTVIGVTHRDDDPGLVAYGQSALVPHILENKQYDAYLRYGKPFRTDDGEECLPLTGEEAKAVSDLIGFDRAGKNGLSLLVPFPNEAATDDRIIRQAIEQSFPQICAGKIAVDAFGVLIDAITVRDVAGRFPELSRLIPAIELAVEASSGNVREFAPKPIAAGKTSLRADLFEPSDVEAMQAAWEAGETVCVRAEVPVARKGGENVAGHFRLLMRRHDDQDSALQISARGCVTVASEPSGNGDYVGLLLAEDGPLSAFLGDSENVSHTLWQQNKVKDKYVHASDTMNRVKGAFRDLNQILTGIESGNVVKNALINYFWTPRSEEAPVSRPKPEVKVQDHPDVVVMPTPGTPESLFKIPSGFIYRVSAAASEVKPGLIQCFYSNRARKKPTYHPADFDLSSDDVAIVAEGGIEWSVTAGNEIEIHSAAPGASLKVTGFDVNRELTVRMVDIKE